MQYFIPILGDLYVFRPYIITSCIFGLQCSIFSGLLVLLTMMLLSSTEYALWSSKNTKNDKCRDSSHSNPNPPLFSSKNPKFPISNPPRRTKVELLLWLIKVKDEGRWSCYFDWLKWRRKEGRATTLATLDWLKPWRARRLEWKWQEGAQILKICILTLQKFRKIRVFSCRNKRYLPI